MLGPHLTKRSRSEVSRGRHWLSRRQTNVVRWVYKFGGDNGTIPPHSISEKRHNDTRKVNGDHTLTTHRSPIQHGLSPPFLNLSELFPPDQSTPESGPLRPSDPSSRCARKAYRSSTNARSAMKLSPRGGRRSRIRRNDILGVVAA